MTSSEKNKPKLVGILNVTPDSFSDGGKFLDFNYAVEHARRMVDEGAAIIDIGGDSTRPGSVCIGAKAEWERIREILRAVAGFSEVSVDTHHGEVAEKALSEGASIINDISAGKDPKMFPLIARSSARIILSYTRCDRPHYFGAEPSGDIITVVKSYFREAIRRADKAGVRAEQIILDPGMGGFISEDASRSWELLRRSAELDELGFPFMLGVSRKGFLKVEGEKDISERDKGSAIVGGALFFRSFKNLQFLRVHNVKEHAEVFNLLLKLAGSDYTRIESRGSP